MVSLKGAQLMTLIFRGLIEAAIIYGFIEQPHGING